MSFGNDVNDILETQDTQCSVPRLETSRYRHHLTDYELTDAQADELLTTLWNIILAALELRVSLDVEAVLTASCPLEKATPSVPAGVKSNHPRNTTGDVVAKSASTRKDRDGE